MRSSQRGLTLRVTTWLREALRRTSPAGDENTKAAAEHGGQLDSFFDFSPQPTTPQGKMIEYFRIVSFHGTNIGVHGRSGAIACVPEGLSEPEYIALVAFELEKIPGLLFLMANSDQPIEVNLGAGSHQAAALPVGQSGANDQATLYDPLTGRYLAAPPIRAADQLAGVTASRDRADEWERFQLVGAHDLEIAGLVVALANTVEQLHGAVLDTDAIVQFIVNSDDPNAGLALDCIVPLLGRNEFSALSKQFISMPELRSKLLRHFPKNPWITAGIAELGAWILRRDAAVLDLKAAAQHTQITIGNDLDVLASGAEGGPFVAGGRFVSFAQACNSLARRRVEPRRRACIVMSARNEGIYLLEWIAYHRAIGFEWFYIYSNNNDDDSDDLLAALADGGVITWIKNEMAPGVRSQYKAYGHAFGILPGILDFEWCLVVDADEFFVPNPDRFVSVSEFLFWQEKAEVDAIALNWKFAASNNEIGCLDELMTRRNTRFVGNPLIGDGFRLIKTMFRPRLMLRARSHTPICDERSSFTYRLSTGELHQYQNNPAGYRADPGFSDSVNTENACIYHYYYKSAEEWLWKNSRNRGDHPMSTGLPPRMFTDEWIKDFMRQNDELEQEHDGRMPVFAAGVDAQLIYLRSLPEVTETSILVGQSYRQRLEELKLAVRSSPILGDMNELSRRFMKLAGII